MYSPKIAGDLIPAIYRRAKLEGVPMTVLVNQIIGDALGKKAKSKRISVAKEKIFYANT